ncbi:hypothetical protein [Empedobacter falsenii]|uniref:hypothetical protein n=2 Tax=Empedobacter TaxID=59734 RepID=UPI001C8E057C|nr:hypothetical protein [Empedobacter falsenii]MBY0067115.1 hypothetical protein [Empedobacter falsenii]
MKKILLSLFILGSFYVSAQDIDIKKGKVLFDKKEVALVEGKKRVYTLSDIQNKPILSIEYKAEPYTYGGNKIWFRLIDLTSNQSNDFETDMKGFSLFNLEKDIVKTFSNGQYKIITSNGIDQSIVQQILQLDKRDIQEEYNNEILDYNKLLDELTELVKSNGIYFDNKGIIYQNNIKIGQILYSPSGFSVDNYTLVENNNYKVGEFGGNSLEISDLNKVYSLKLKELENPLKDKSSRDIKNNKFFTQIVGFALKNGFALNTQLQIKNSTEERVDYQNKIAEAKANSSNLYDVPGFLIDEKGNKVAGKLSINFENATSKVEKSNIESLPENYGKSVYVKAVNEKGKEKSTRYKSNTGAKFCTDSGDCYIGLKTIGNVFNSIGNVMSLSTDFSYFYKILNEDNGFLILEEPSNNKLYIKIPNQEKALYLGNNNDDKLEKNFNEYIKCSLNVTDFDLKSVDGIKTFFEKYKTTCK